MINVVRQALQALASGTSCSTQGLDTVNEIEREGLDALTRIDAALDSIILRCSEGNPQTDWLPTIERLAREARGQ